MAVSTAHGVGMQGADLSHRLAPQARQAAVMETLNPGVLMGALCSDVDKVGLGRALLQSCGLCAIDAVLGGGQAAAPPEATLSPAHQPGANGSLNRR
jgi:hypothetical protein